MDFSERIRKLAERLRENKPKIRSEAQTKQWLVLPFIAALGYDTYDPDEVVPGYSVDADAGSGGKMDYAILKDGDPILLIECREVGTLLGREHRSRLTRYFMLPRYFRVAREARFAILTNGMVYQFFTALDEQHRMDLEPFLSVDMARLDEGQVRELARFRREVFDADEIFASVRELRLRREIGARVAAELREPSEALVRHFARGMYGERPTGARMAELTRLVRAALRQYLDEQARAQFSMRPAVEAAAPARREDRREVAPGAPEASPRRPVMPTTPGPPPRRPAMQPARRPGGLPDFSVHTPWSKADWELRQLFMALYSLVMDLGEDMRVEPRQLHIRFKRKYNVVDVQLQTGARRLLTWVRLDPGSVRLQKGFTRDVTRIGRHSPNRLEVRIASLEDLERARPLLERSYAENG